jgi:hypothetical protein
MDMEIKEYGLNGAPRQRPAAPMNGAARGRDQADRVRGTQEK